MSALRSRVSTPRLAFLVLLTIVASAATGAAVYWTAAEALTRIEREKYAALMQVRGGALREYLESLREEVRFWAQNRIMREALVEFSGAWSDLEDPTPTLQRLYLDDNPYPIGERDNLERADDDSRYSVVHARYHYWLRSFLLHRGVYDVFLFDPDGDLVYTSFKESDYATNLVSGPYRDTDLGAAFRAALENPYPSYVAFFDFAPYAPSHGAPASFIAAPVLDDDGTFLGALAFQIPSERINEIMHVTNGLGDSGETYVVGPDLLMRSDSRFSEESTILKTRVDTTTVRRAHEGETGLDVTPDYRGVPVLSAYGPLEFQDVRWAVMAEVDEAEVLAPIRLVRNRTLLFAALFGAAAALIGARVLLRKV